MTTRWRIGAGLYALAVGAALAFGGGTAAAERRGVPEVDHQPATRRPA
jgi:hypothetical protein